jgi:hypothetical protein
MKKKKITDLWPFFLGGILLFLPQALSAQHPTWSKDIVAIVEAHCAVCHHKGTSAPFDLLTYEDVAKRASNIKRVVTARYMPPWKADPHYASFSNERILSDKEIKAISDWVDAGAPRGAVGSRTAPTPTPFVENTRLGRKPDLILSTKQAYLVKGDNQERFLVFYIPYEIPEEKNVESIEFSANNYKLIHHVNYGFHAMFRNSGGLQIPDSVDLLNDAAKYGVFNLISEKLVYYSGWLPGTTYESYPGNMGWVLPKRGMALLYMHYAPSPVDQEVKGEIHLFFKEKAIERQISVVNIGTGGKGDIDPPLVIPANSIKTFKATIVTRSDQSVLFAWPHMHLLGKSIKAYAITPSKDTIPLISIPSWDFSWQDIYKYRHLVKIPAGSLVTVEATYDNTADNPRNPFNPPRTVESAHNLIMKTTDEMLNLLLIYLPYQPGDESVSLQ